MRKRQHDRRNAVHYQFTTALNLQRHQIRSCSRNRVAHMQKYGARGIFHPPAAMREPSRVLFHSQVEENPRHRIPRRMTVAQPSAIGCVGRFPTDATVMSEKSSLGKLA
jgi:hypothetical protein